MASTFMLLAIIFSIAVGAFGNVHGYQDAYHGVSKSHQGPAAAPVVDTTVIQGYVYCQGCSGYWTKSLEGAKVVAECKNRRGYGSLKGVGVTNHVGFYQIKLPYDYKSASQNCKATVVSSSDRSCRVVTNVGNGKWGAGVSFLKTFYNEAFFKSGPFAFSPSSCPHHGPHY